MPDKVRPIITAPITKQALTGYLRSDITANDDDLAEVLIGTSTLYEVLTVPVLHKNKQLTVFMDTGKVNFVADSLSRNIAFVTATPEHPKHDNQIAIPNIEEEQRNDSFCAPIIYYLESGDDTQLPKLPVPLTEFRLKYNLLVRDTYLTIRQEPKRQKMSTHIALVAFVVYTLLQLLSTNGIYSLVGDQIYNDIVRQGALLQKQGKVLIVEYVLNVYMPLVDEDVVTRNYSC
ncbi:hypothetical protein GWK47_041485 [Chionoecetes opilio]|uniref:Uncharacterized protein n=1 Tax=Chionoecetes opilio TaxID=41210 RepID=A0A8J4Y9S4_CHIOP|nr:hypothetical protein GWK47_041485 [Chionoecetes opilio]